jgi:hypothetical protein
LGFWPLSQDTAYALIWVAWGALLGAGIGQAVGEGVGPAAGALLGAVAFGLIHRAWAGGRGR